MLILGCLFGVFLVTSANEEITDSKYALMPELFYLDNFDQCMLVNGQFCTFTFALQPLNASLVWDIIKEVSDNPQNYRHDFLRHGICLPKTCPETYDERKPLRNIVESCYNRKYNGLGLYGTVSDLVCQDNESKLAVDIYDIVFGSLVVFYVLFVIFASIYERYIMKGDKLHYYEQTKSSHFIAAFSIPKNWHRLRSTSNTNPEYRKLRSIQGIRFYNIICVILSHTIMGTLGGAVSNPRYTEQAYISGMSTSCLVIPCSLFGINQFCINVAFLIAVLPTESSAGNLNSNEVSPAPNIFMVGDNDSNNGVIYDSTKHVLNMFIANGWYIVQTFFVISGWLLSYHFFEMTTGSKHFKITYIFWAILNRYVRLVPAVALMVGFHGTWLVHLSKGPYWDMFVGEEYRNCRKNWWTNVLFVNNYIDNNNMCLHQTWYIAADMQLFMVSVAILYVIWNYPKALKYIFGTLLFVGFLTPGLIAYVNNHDIIIRQYPEILYNLNLLRLDHWHQLYSSAYSNIFGYTVGMVFGYLFFTYKNEALNINKIHVILWWFLSFGMCIFVVLIAVVFYDPNFSVTPLKSALYWSCGKNLFALGIAIGIFGLTQKIGWFARWFCEFQPVQVLGRLTYSTYIIHVAFIRWQMGYRRYPASANDSMIFFAVLRDVTLAYLGGTLLCLFLEMPVSALQKLMGFRQNKRPAKMSAEKSLETLDLDSDNGQTQLKL